MSIQCDAIAAALDELRVSISCAPVGDDRMTLATGRYFADGDSVDVMAKISTDGERIVVSDGGIVQARLHLHGSSAASKTAQQMWDDILEDFGVSATLDGRIYTTRPVSRAHDAIVVLADTMVALDSVRLLTSGERRTFSDELRSWLEDQPGLKTKRESTVRNAFGSIQKITAIVESPRGDIAVQGVAGKGLSPIKKAAEHAFWVMSGIENYGLENRLIVLQQTPRDTDGLKPVLSMLERVSYVGVFNRTDAVRQFLSDRTAPKSRDFVLESYGQQSIEPH